MKCLECQTELNENDTKCPKCGLPIYKLEQMKLPQPVSNQMKRLNPKPKPKQNKKLTINKEKILNKKQHQQSQHCLNCGNIIQENDNYCKNCGVKITDSILIKEDTNIKIKKDKKGNIFGYICIICEIINFLAYEKVFPVTSIIALLSIVTGKMLHPKNELINIIFHIYLGLIILAVVSFALLAFMCEQTCGNMPG